MMKKERPKMKIRTTYPVEKMSGTTGALPALTFSNQRGNQIARAYAIPTNPKTDGQYAVRSAFGSLSAYWRDTLTNIERQTWDQFAAANPITKAGATYYTSGIAWFKKINEPRKLAGLTVMASAPISGGGTAPGSPLVLSLSSIVLADIPEGGDTPGWLIRLTGETSRALTTTEHGYVKISNALVGTRKPKAFTYETVTATGLWAQAIAPSGSGITVDQDGGVWTKPYGLVANQTVQVTVEVYNFTALGNSLIATVTGEATIADA